ncbi:unnamed protein product [Leuciscus chuanchicus]
MSKWVVEAISLAYEAAGQPSPWAVRSHSTRSMAASKALISGVSLQDVCDAAGWSSPHTFVRCYSLDLDSTPGSQPEEDVELTDWTEHLKAEEFGAFWTHEYKVAFAATLGHGFGPFHEPVTVVYNNVLVNVRRAYNPTTGIFTAPVKGVYFFMVSALHHSTMLMDLRLFKNDQQIMTLYNEPQGSGRNQQGKDRKVAALIPQQQLDESKCTNVELLFHRVSLDHGREGSSAWTEMALPEIRDDVNVGK